VARKPDAIVSESVEVRRAHDRMPSNREAVGAELVKRDEQDVQCHHGGA
jgi:hypothetical protein